MTTAQIDHRIDEIGENYYRLREIAGMNIARDFLRREIKSLILDFMDEVIGEDRKVEITPDNLNNAVLESLLRKMLKSRARELLEREK